MEMFKVCVLLVGWCYLMAKPAAAGNIPLAGYFCSSCPGNLYPVELFAEIHPAYSTVVLAFVGWDSEGNVVNYWDFNAPWGRNFTLTKDMVSRLQVRLFSSSHGKPFV
jgi:hypothetical protein